MTTLTVAERIALAFICGTLIGFERQYRQRMATMRTSALVAVGAALFVVIPAHANTAQAVAQVAGQIASGIGFLAGAVIFREGLSVQGLNTAATLWGTAAVGTLAGLGLAVEAALGTVGVLAANIVLRPLSRLIDRRSLDQTEIAVRYIVAASVRESDEDAVRAEMIAAARSAALTLYAVSDHDLADGRVEVVADVATAGRPDARLERVVARLGRHAGVSAVSWKVNDEASTSHALGEE